MTMVAPRSRPDPMLDDGSRDFLMRRGTELIGLCLLLLGLAAASLLASYSAEDPSPFNATGAVPQNLLGLTGAHVAGTLVFALGWAAWGIAAGLTVWGGRLMLHRGEERVLTRTLFALIAILALAAFMAAHVPPGTWPHRFGLGGTLGDSLLANLLALSPFEASASLRPVTLALAPLVLLLSSLGLGVSGTEARQILRLSAAGFHALAALMFRVLGFVGLRAWAGTRALSAEVAMRRHERAAARLQTGEAEPEPVLFRTDGPARPADGEDDDRLMARISAAVRARGAAPVLPPQPEPVVLARPEAGEPVPLTRLRPTPDLPPDFEEFDDLVPEFGQPGEPERAEPAAKARVQHRPVKPVAESARAKSEAQPQLALGDLPEAEESYDAPPLSLLANPSDLVRQHMSEEALEENARMLENVLDDYGVRGEIVSVRPGPVVTLYELEPAPGTKASRVIGLADDIARSMSALSARIATVPGRSVIGIELPNTTREKVLLREILSSRPFGDSGHRLPLALGKDIGGEPVVANLARMPHLLIAGTTGSGKSVAINTMILSLLYRLSPRECRMIMIDPKMLELSVYDGIPHLLSPVVTDPKKAVVALKWVVAEMEERYRKMSKLGVRNIDGYNARVGEAIAKGEAFNRVVQTGFHEDTGEPIFENEEFAPESMPFIVVVVDEMADLMMVAGKEIEACIQRLAQMARASGIHLIMATQRPSVDVITGTIKANFPTRISFQVTSKIDSRTILGEQGAEQLLGMGDMLYMAGGGRITRIHGPFCTDEEVEQIVNHLKLIGATDYVPGVVEGPDEEAEGEIDLVLGLGNGTVSEEALYDQAVAIAARDRKCSTSYIQRKLGIGYQRAARLVEQMEEDGVISRANQVGKREVLVPER